MFPPPFPCRITRKVNKLARYSHESDIFFSTSGLCHVIQKDESLSEKWCWGMLSQERCPRNGVPWHRPHPGSLLQSLAGLVQGRLVQGGSVMRGHIAARPRIGGMTAAQWPPAEGAPQAHASGSQGRDWAQMQEFVFVPALPWPAGRTGLSLEPKPVSGRIQGGRPAPSYPHHGITWVTVIRPAMMSVRAFSTAWRMASVIRGALCLSKAASTPPSFRPKTLCPGCHCP